MKYILFMILLVSFSFCQTSLKVKIDGMHCPLCTMAVKKAIKNLNGIQKVSVKLNTKIADISYDEKKVSVSKILEAIKTTSYEGVVLKEDKYSINR